MPFPLSTFGKTISLSSSLKGSLAVFAGSITFLGPAFKPLTGGVVLRFGGNLKELAAKACSTFGGFVGENGKALLRISAEGPFGGPVG